MSIKISPYNIGESGHRKYIDDVKHNDKLPNLEAIASPQFHVIHMGTYWQILHDRCN